MVKLKFVVRNDNLVLRISENKERFYKSVKHLLEGNPNVERHWNNDKEKFSSYAASFTENNRILDEFKKSYSSLIKDYPELSAKQVAQFYSSKNQEEKNDTEINTLAVCEKDLNFVENFLDVVIECR